MSVKSSTSNGSAESSGLSKYFINTWNYGRPSNPKIDALAWNLLPWKTVAVSTVCLALLVLYAAFGLPASSAYSPYLYLILTPILILVLALPVFAMIAIPMSYFLDPPAAGNPEKFFTFKPSMAQWKGRKIPVLTLYEAFFAGELSLAINPETNKPYDLLQVLYHRNEFSRFVIEFQHVEFFFLKFIPELLRHTRSQDVEQVREHYDRGDDFYAAFLGETMIYTSGIFHNENETLEEAQKNKLELVAQKIHLKKGEYHLDLGCGWGALINHFAKEYGTNSTGITLGKNQTEWANNWAKRNKVEANAKALCMDYRDSPRPPNASGKYNKITCLEMSEHVGVKYYSTFCSQIYDLLDDDGIFFLQIAGLRRPWQYEDFTWGLFMGKYVFPGADASCPLGWVINQLESAGFEIRSEETIGIHYSATIKRWYDNWLVNEKSITAKYGQRWFRTWQWFLSWSVISPEQGSASCYQIVCHKNTKTFDRKQFLAEKKYWKV